MNHYQDLQLFHQNDRLIIIHLTGQNKLRITFKYELVLLSGNYFISS